MAKVNGTRIGDRETISEPCFVSFGTPERDFTMAYGGAHLSFVRGMIFTADRPLRAFMVAGSCPVVWSD